MSLRFAIPDAFFLKKIQTRHLYCDKKSKEESTGVIKWKFKLAGIQEDILTDAIHIYRFFVGTSKASSCEKNLTLEVKPSDWEHINSPYMHSIGALSGYFDVKKIEVLNQDDLLEKLKDTANGFQYAAKLHYDVFGRLQTLAYALHRAHKPISAKKVPHIISALIRENDEATEILKTLGL